MGVDMNFYGINSLGGLLLAAVIITSAGCASTPDRIVLLPNADGTPSALILKTANGERVIDHPYEAVGISSKGVITALNENRESVNARYGAVLAAQPKRPMSFTVYFFSGENKITPESQAVVEQMKTDMKTRNAPEIIVIGHTDRVGTLEANDALSLERAMVMRGILIEGGIPDANINIAGRGEREPLVPTEDEVPEPKNRRVEISVR
jgi:outer membrane protein OmpA-like peptidoglycan-associated protein